MTEEAREVLNACDTIIGYTVYVDLVKEQFPEKEFLTTPMKQEVKRCKMAFEEAMKGKKVAMICSGDAGVYGMAGLMYEVGVEFPKAELCLLYTSDLIRIADYVSEIRKVKHPFDCGVYARRGIEY